MLLTDWCARFTVKVCPFGTPLPDIVGASCPFPRRDPFMLAKRVIPCLDVDRGRVVKGTNFLQLRDAGDPVEVASRYEAEGADELVFLDITASHEDRGIMLDVVRRTAEQVFMPLTVGGGIRTLSPWGAHRPRPRVVVLRQEANPQPEVLHLGRAAGQDLRGDPGPVV